MNGKKHILLFFLIFLILSSPELAQAQAKGRRGEGVTQVGTYPRHGIYADVAYFFGSNTISSTGSNASTRNSFLDLKLGYINEVGFYYGGQYTFKNSSDDVSTSEGRGSGAGLGYFWVSGIDVRVAYRFHESYGNYTDGSGYQIDVGYSGRITPALYIGVLVDYRDITFKIHKQDPTIRSTVMRTLQPALTLGYSFR